MKEKQIVAINNKSIETALVEDYKLTKKESNGLIEAYGLPINEVGEIINKASKIVVNNETEGDKMADARKYRLELRTHRINFKKKHDEIKADYLKMTNGIDYIYRVAENIIKPVETHLKQQEDFIEIKKKLKLDKLVAERGEKLAKFAEHNDLTIYKLELMSDEAFETLLANLEANEAQRLKIEAEAEQARKDEEERTKRELEAQRGYNERVEQFMRLGFILTDKGFEYDGIKGAVKAERLRELSEDDYKDFMQGINKAVEKAKAEAEKVEAEKQAEREKLQAEAEKARKDEAERNKQAELERKKAEAEQAKPDKEKLEAYVKAIFGTEAPKLDTAEGQAKYKEIRQVLVDNCNKMMGIVNA